LNIRHNPYVDTRERLEMGFGRMLPFACAGMVHYM
jgi:hypothetical protein